MAEYCSRCGKQIGSSTGYRFEDSVLCGTCLVTPHLHITAGSTDDASISISTEDIAEPEINGHESKGHTDKSGISENGIFDQCEWAEEDKRLGQREYRQEVVHDFIVKRTCLSSAGLSDVYLSVEKAYEEQVKESNPAITGLSLCCICGQLLRTLAPDEELSEMGVEKEYLPYEDVSDVELPVSIDPLRFCKTCGVWAEEVAGTEIADYRVAEREVNGSIRDELIPTLEKYVGSKSDTFKVQLWGLKNTDFIDRFVLTDSLHLVQRARVSLKYTGYLTQAVEMGHSDLDVEAIMEFTDENIEFLEELTKDLELLSRLFEKRETEVNYRELLFVLLDMNKKPFDNNVLRAITSAIHKRAPIPGDLESVLETMYRLPARTMFTDEMWKVVMVPVVLDAFGLEKPENLDDMIRSIEDTLELEEFERSFKTKPVSTNTPMQSYDNLDGYAFEQWLKQLFTRLGYQSAVTKKSGDQGADLVVKKSGVTYVVQAKKYATPVPNSAIQEAVAAKAIYGADKAIVVATSSFTDSAWELAVANQVELWDKSTLDDKLIQVNDKSEVGDGTAVFVSSLDIDTGLVRGKLRCIVCGYENQLTNTASERYLKYTTKCEFCGNVGEISADLTEHLTCSACHRIFNDLESFRQHKLECD